MTQVSVFDLFSPTDYRYYVEELKPFLSEEAFTKYKTEVETGLARVQARRGLTTEESADEIERAAREVTAEEVYREEETTRHDIIALRNRITARVSDEAKSAVHRPATSYDIVEPANAARYRDAFKQVIIPDMIELERHWIKAARDGKDILQIGRTHLQHAEPITYGFAMAWYLSRFGNRILKVNQAVDELTGKFSGSVGAYNASSLFFEDPEEFEKEVLAELGLKPAEISTQIAPLEPAGDLVHYTISALSILANWADDMRNLQRPEIAEVGQLWGADVSASSIMPHKRNPVGLENIKSAWKATMPFAITMYLDQLSDNQRDLTNSASQRFVCPVFVQFDYAVRRAARIAKSIQPHPQNMRRNLELSADKIVSEPLQIILSSHGHPNAHHYVEGLVEKSYMSGKPLTELALNDPALQPYLAKFTQKQMKVIQDPSLYVGIAAAKTQKVADLWEARLDQIRL